MCVATISSGAVGRSRDRERFFCLLFVFDFALLYVYRADDGRFVVGFFVAPKTFFARRVFVDFA